MSIRKSSETLTVERLVCGTEHGWCRAVSGGTGITVLAFQVSPSKTAAADTCHILRNSLHKILNAHPILRSKLHYNTATMAFSFTIPATPQIQIKSFDAPSTLQLLQSMSDSSVSGGVSLSPFHLITEHELSNNAAWINPVSFPPSGVDVFFATVYAIPDGKDVVALRFHTAVCDRTTAVSLLRELMEVMGEGTLSGIKNEGEGSFGIDDIVPREKSKKKLWAHGLDMLGYSVNSFRLTNLMFKDVKGPRCSRLVRLQMNQHDTSMILDGCNYAGIKLCGVLMAAGLMAAHSSKSQQLDHPQKKKYGIVTLTDCRSILDSPLSTHHFGFYHSAVLNMHNVKGGEKLWELAKASYGAFANSKKSNKHFSDMADLNFLMCKAIDNPTLTASSALRSCFMTVFEDTVVHDYAVGVEDFVGCASAHGIGPSVAIFDTIIDGKLDCVCVYPWPLHSREQMQQLVDDMKRLLIDAATTPGRRS